MTRKALTQKDEPLRAGASVRVVDGPWRGRVGFVKSQRGEKWQVRSQARNAVMTDVFWLRSDQIERVGE
jgi:hypothetical protein